MQILFKNLFSFSANMDTHRRNCTAIPRSTRSPNNSSGIDQSITWSAVVGNTANSRPLRSRNASGGMSTAIYNLSRDYISSSDKNIIDRQFEFAIHKSTLPFDIF